MKGFTLRRIIPLILVVVTLMGLWGCQPKAKELLLVEFKQDRPLKYKIVSERDIVIELVGEEITASRKPQSHKMYEKLEMVISYTTIEENPFGLTTVEGKCESAKVERRAFKTRGAEPKDIAEELAGRTFKFKVSPTGGIEDFSELTALVKELGAKTFVEGSRAGRVKNPDMLGDFIAVQWYMFDPISKMDKPFKGAKIGKSWTAKQLIPLPVPIPANRDTTYTLNEISGEEGSRKAHIASSFAISEDQGELANWPQPFEGKYNIKGSLFAVLRNYRWRSIEGGGGQVFNINTGTLESDKQKWKMIIDASFMLPLGTTLPVITVDQKINVELLSN